MHTSGQTKFNPVQCVFSAAVNKQAPKIIMKILSKSLTIYSLKLAGGFCLNVSIV